VPNAVERSSSGLSALKEESILANSTQIRKTNRQGRRAGQNMIRGTRAAIYTHLATVYTTFGIRARPTRPTRPEGTPGLVPRPAQARLFVRPVGSTVIDTVGARVRSQLREDAVSNRSPSR
jgi:hypothetical protein